METYYEVRQTLLQSRAASCYYKVRQEILQSVAGNLLQSGTTFLQSGAAVIKKTSAPL